MKSFEELVDKSVEHAGEAEDCVAQAHAEIQHLDPAQPGEAMGIIGVYQGMGQIHATLAEAYARLASALVVNRTSSIQAMQQASVQGGRVS